MFDSILRLGFLGRRCVGGKVKEFKKVTLIIITIAVVLIAALSISSYVGQVRQEMKARDYAIRACNAETPTTSSLNYAALAASLDDRYNLLNGYQTAAQQFNVANLRRSIETDRQVIDAYLELAVTNYLEMDSMEPIATRLCASWKGNPVSWWPWG
jgi:hypothetical protein